jgi:hypothetical protein
MMKVSGLINRISRKVVLLVLLMLAVAVIIGINAGWPAAGIWLLAAGGWAAAFFLRADFLSTRRRLESGLLALSREAAAARQAAADALCEAELVRKQAGENDSLRAEDSRRLETLIHLNRGLVNATDEQGLMDTALSALTELVGALGCSFVPVDEWDQPLPPFTYGQLPEPVLRAWAAHLTDGMLRERCGSCRVTAFHCRRMPAASAAGGQFTHGLLPAARSDEW